MSQLDLLQLPNCNPILGIPALINRLFNPKGLSASNTADRASLESQGEFVKGINFNGKAITIEGNSWLSYSDALASGLSIPGAIYTESSLKPQPRADRDTKSMLSTVVCKGQRLEIIQTIPNGTYEVYLWIVENHESDYHSIDVSLGGQIVARGIGKLPVNNWAKYGPYRTTVTDGALHLALDTNTPERDAHLMGMAIFKPNSTEG